MTSNLSHSYDKHRYLFIEPLKRQPYGKSGVGYIKKEIIDRNKIYDSYFLRDIPGDNKGRRMLERIRYNLDKGLKRKKPTEHVNKKIKIKKSPSSSISSSSSVSSNDSIDKIIKKLSGKKLIFEDDEHSPVKKIASINIIKTYLNKPLTKYEQKTIDKYINTPLTKSEKEILDRYINK